MRRLKSLLRRIRLVYRRSSTLTKAVVLSAIVLSAAALLTLNLTVRSTDRQTQELRDKAAELEHQNSQLEQKIDGLGSAEGVAQIAGEELGLVDPDAVVIAP